MVEVATAAEKETVPRAVAEPEAVAKDSEEAATAEGARVIPAEGLTLATREDCSAHCLLRLPRQVAA